MKTRDFLVSCLLLISPLVLHAQKNTNPERLGSLKTLAPYKDSEVAAFENTSLYTFKVAGEAVTVSSEEIVKLISLKGNVDYVKRIFYNDHIKIESEELKYANGKSLKKASVCGNYEVDGIFYSDAKVCAHRFNLLYEGTEAVFKSSTRYDDARYFTRVFLHDEDPTVQREIVFTIPANVQVELVERNFEGFDIKKTVEQSNGNTVYRYVGKNLTALQSEDNSLGIMHHFPHLVVLTKSFATSNGQKKNVLSSVEDLYAWYSGLVKDVKNDPRSFQEEVKRLTATAKTPEDKIKAIYYWVQDNIKYIAFEDGIAGFRPDAAQNVYNNRYGDCKGMANLTKEMLKVAGFDARLTWIGTNRIPYTYDLPSLCVDNHMICTLTINEKLYILDSTEKYVALGKNAERIQGKEMLIENGDKFIRKKVPLADFSSNLIVRTESLSLDGETIKGQGELVLNGEAKKNILYYSTNVKQEDTKKIFDNMAVADYSSQDKVQVTNEPPIDREKPLEVKYSYTLTNKVSKFGKETYVNMDWIKNFEDMQIPEDRVTDYYFNRKIKQKTVKKLKIPAGYKASYLPKGMNRKHADFSFEVSFKQVGNEVIYTNELTVTNGIIKKSVFSTWNEYIKELRQVYNDQIILTKTN